MKKEFAEFLFKRLNGKVSHLRDVSDEHEMQLLLDDVDEYLSVLKDVVIEVIKP